MKKLSNAEMEKTSGGLIWAYFAVGFAIGVFWYWMRKRKGGRRPSQL